MIKITPSVIIKSRRGDFLVILTPRLEAVASFVKEGSVIADVGTDHGYIPAYLINKGIIKKAIAADINVGPLENAKKTMKNEGIDSVEFVLSDGLKNLGGSQFDEIIIAGMGGEMIASILDNSSWCKDKKYSFILQPMTKEDYLRRYLYENGFEIIKETLAAEKDKLYNIMKAVFVGEKRKITDSFALLGKTSADELFEEKKSREILRLTKIHKSLKNKENSSDEREKIKKLIEEIEDYR